MNLKIFKQYSILLVKIIVIAAAFYFIYNQLFNNNKVIWSDFENKIREQFSISTIVLLLVISVLNRYLEILKWKNLVSFIKPISTYESAKQVLAALTTGIVTPNGIGEYAGKALFFEKINTKKIVLLNFICNGIQMVFTVSFGLVGLFILQYYDLAISILGAGLVIFMVVYFTKNIKIKNYSISTLVEKTNEIPKTVHQKNIALGFLRYFVFSHQYYILFLVLNVNIPYITLISTIAIVYFLASSLPSFQMFDFAVKGSVALLFFAKYNINEWIIFFASTVMWLLNVVLPVIIGSFFVLNLKSKWK
jgi:hypothetical protein